MIKGPQIEDLEKSDFHYITAITRAQIVKLLKQGDIQLDMFDEDLTEVRTDAKRYVLRRNPMRAREIAATRESKLRALEDKVCERNAYLREHSRASVAAAAREVQKKAATLKIAAWTSVQQDESRRVVSVTVDRAFLDEKEKLDGCYVLTTDLLEREADKETVHGRYKDLSMVEHAFRTAKTAQLEMRPIFLRRERRTRGHVFVVMLAYRIVRELARRWSALDITVQEGIDQLATVCSTEILDNGKPVACQIPEPRQQIKDLLEAAGVVLPQAFRSKGVIVTTKRKLQSRRVKD